MGRVQRKTLLFDKWLLSPVCSSGPFTTLMSSVGEAPGGGKVAASAMRPSSTLDSWRCISSGDGNPVRWTSGESDGDKDIHKRGIESVVLELQRLQPSILSCKFPCPVNRLILQCPEWWFCTDEPLHEDTDQIYLHIIKTDVCQAMEIRTFNRHWIFQQFIRIPNGHDAASSTSSNTPGTRKKFGGVDWAASIRV